MKKSRKFIVGGAIAVVLIVIVVIILIANKKEVVFNTATTHIDTIETTVMATGYIQPVEEVEVGTQVSGEIAKIYVDYNSHVVKGQLLAELDRSTLEEQLTQANASLSSAKSDLLYAQQNYDRVKHLHDAKAATDVSLEEAINRLSQAQNSLAKAQADAKQAKVNRDYAFIYSPIDGVILDRQVNVGQTVAASFSTPTLFTIAEDLTKMQVEVDVDEADIGMVKVGQKATFTVDAYTEDVFEGTVQQVRLQPTTTNNVVTYTVIVEAPNPDEKLLPGMTANITVKVQSEMGLTVPLEALSFRMTSEIAKSLGVSTAGLIPTAGAQNIYYTMRYTDNRSDRHMVWVKNGDGIEPREIVTGIGDGVNTIVTQGLREDEEVVLSVTFAKKSETKNSSRNPLMPGPRR